MRLRVLTKGFGTAVRGVYKKAEGVEGLEVIITFQNRSRGAYTEHKTGALKHWDEAEPFSEQRDEGVLKAIDDAVKTMGGKKLRHKSETAIAVACSLSDAVMAKLAFDSDAPVQIKMLDIKTLEEVVHDQ